VHRVIPRDGGYEKASEAVKDAPKGTLFEHAAASQCAGVPGTVRITAGDVINV
jgi:hypothetical protein